MSVLKLNSDWDLAVENSSFVLETGTEEIRQNLLQRLRFFYGEWFLDTRLGIPYFDQILIKSPNPVLLDTIFKRAIIETPGVQELLSFDMDFDAKTRSLKLEFQVRTKDGIITISDFEV